MDTPEWIETYTGQKFYYSDPESYHYTIYEIAHCLANICRYNGHCSKFFSVAQHSVLCCKIGSLLCVDYGYKINTSTMLGLLLHDAAEAYIGDIVRPLKPRLNIDSLERRIKSSIYKQLDVKEKLVEKYIIEEVDLIALAYEKKRLYNSAITWGCLSNISDIRIRIIEKDIPLPDDTMHTVSSFIRIYTEATNYWSKP